MAGPGGHIAILMATHNGAAWLQDQLDSLVVQDHRNWSLWVSDDGSTDDTRVILSRFASAQPDHRIEVLEGPRRGPTRNFLSLVARVDPKADAFAFCDQDDVWLPHRLSRGMALLCASPAMPTLVGYRTMIVDGDLKQQGLSPLFCRPPSFGNALVQSIVGGNTMLFNRAALDLMRQAGTDLDVVTHDWWAYQLISGAGGRVIYDPTPGLLYRQHGQNLIGSNIGWRARVARSRALFQSRFHRWNMRNLTALDGCADLLTPEARAQISAFHEVRRLRGIAAMRALRRSGLVRQTTLGTLSLFVAAALGKL